MVDVVDKATRSRMMSGIRAQNTKPELKVRKILHAAGFRYRLHVRTLPGSPDLVLPRHKAVVFVHGCFWHRHRGCRFAYMPKSNKAFWKKKFDANVSRDRRSGVELRKLGWRVLTVWECRANQKGLNRTIRSLSQGAC